MKKGFITNIEKDTLENNDYRRVLYTGENSQLVVMSIEPGDDIGEEVHELDQFIRIEQGEAKVVLNKLEEHSIKDNFGVIIPAGTIHNVINTGKEALKLYSIYSPPEHKDGSVHKTKSEEKEEHFDGVTSE